MTDWTPLNAKTSERWLRCEAGKGHRYSDETIWRDALVWHVCQRCRVPAIVVRTQSMSRKSAAGLAARWSTVQESRKRGSDAGGQTRRERAV